MEQEITNLKIMMAKVEEKLNSIGNSLELNVEQHREIINNQEQYMKEMKEFIEKVISTKADKWVETCLIWFFRSVAGIAIVGLLGLIYKVIILIET